jgi:hypothetical protein
VEIDVDIGLARCTWHDNLRELLFSEILESDRLEYLDQEVNLEVELLDELMEASFKLLEVEELTLV